ncbi:cytochrome ubiquinol oxidase subunit I [Sporomusa termitida]|uniref:Cytochrome bd ubiquinol oxidase subunit 1 n=1 Tax=Sporomusa termitida TaxID=2377 RepID=A0A517DWH4_9FIRM|nr:cytochrome ubiquinol oxidase subunit I [Sporomusa termitida]QDR81704.1 Cytochrome bd ubiquinol oxidase subunit 1 [Sporomusa termitida]
MDKLLLARLQFSTTLTYHFWFLSLTLGLVLLIALLETMYVRSGNNNYKVLAKFWGKLFLINYAVGILTGIIQEFEFGMNWSEYSRFVGDIFGVPLAIETLTAFFVESTFIGLWVYGWDQLPKRLHLAAIWLVAVAANISAFWILTANAFMQHPAGYILAGERLELLDFIAVITNPYVFYQYPHTVLAGVMTAGFFMMAVSSYYLLHKRYTGLFRISFKMGFLCAAIATALVIGTGHVYTQYLGKAQPMKLAAMEALWETSDQAPFTVVALIDKPNSRNSFEISVPGLLSIMAGNHAATQVQGIKDLQAGFTAAYGPGEYIPPVALLFWSFRIMLVISMYLVVLLLVVYWYWRTQRLEASPFLLRTIMWSIPLPYIAHTAGWIITEVGRQPWIVYTLLRTEQGISKVVPLVNIGISLTGYTVIYLIMTAAALYFMRKVIIAGPEA